MMNERIHNIKKNKELSTPEQLKSSLEKINLSFSEYIKSLNKDFDERPDSLKNSNEHSAELINAFKTFYNDYNILSNEMLTNNIQNKNNTSNEKNEIIIDNITVNEINFLLEDKIHKIKKQNEDTREKIKQYINDLNNLPIYTKPKK